MHQLSRDNTVIYYKSGEEIYWTKNVKREWKTQKIVNRRVKKIYIWCLLTSNRHMIANHIRLWGEALNETGVPEKYVKLIDVMYKSCHTYVHSVASTTDGKAVAVGPHQCLVQGCP